MGKVGRFACILVPMIFTISSLLCVLLLLLSGTNKNLRGLELHYQTKLKTKDFVLAKNIDILPGSTLDPEIKTGFDNEKIKLRDFYTSYMWNYCAGDIEEDDGKEVYTITDCKPTAADYSLDIHKIVEEKSSGKAKFPDSITKIQKTMNIVSRFMVVCYLIGFVATLVTFFIGWFGLLSRWGSCLTTIFSNVSFGFLFIASCCSTAISYSFVGALNKGFKDFKIDATVGQKWLMTTWIATAFAFAASLFWLLSTCCCSGRTNKVMDTKGKESTKSVKVEHTPYTYERVASPYTGGSNVSLKEYGYKKPGFEPMRHGQV